MDTDTSLYSLFFPHSISHCCVYKFRTTKCPLHPCFVLFILFQSFVRINMPFLYYSSLSPSFLFDFLFSSSIALTRFNTLAIDKQIYFCNTANILYTQTGRPILYACSWPAYEIRRNPDWASISKHCNLWRNYNDIMDSWSSILSIIDFYVEFQDENARFHGPGHWFDPDMILVGEFLL